MSVPFALHAKVASIRFQLKGIYFFPSRCQGKCDYSYFSVDFCQKNNIQFILRGLRNPADFEFEKSIAHTNRDLAPVETVFLLTTASTSYISSSIVREVIKHHGDYTKLVPKSVRITQ